MTYFELKKYISGRLAAKCGELADYEAMLFISRLCGISRAEFLLRMNDDAVFDKDMLESFLSRRINGESAEYIIGETTFFDLRIKLSRDCLVPRADTEFVVEKALGFIDKKALFFHSVARNRQKLRHIRIRSPFNILL